MSASPARIAVLVTAYPVLSETFVTAEIAALRDLGHAVRVESKRPPDRPNPEVTPAHPVACAADDRRTTKALALAWLAARHPLRCARDLRTRRRYAAQEPVERLRALAPVAWRLRRARIEHLHVHFAVGSALDALRLGAILDLPYSVTAHAWEIYKEPRNLEAKLRAAAFSTSGCDYTVADLRRIAGPGAAVHRIVMGVDADVFRRSTPPPGTGHVLAVGRLVEKKGFADLLDAAARVPATRLTRLTIVGDGPLRGELEARVAALGLQDRVVLAGALAPSAIRRALEDADVLAMPCVVARDGDRDSMPVVVKEALAMALPVVATREVGLPELVRDDWGRLVAPHDPAALADALDELLALPAAERDEMGRRGRAFVREHCDVATETARLSRLVAAAVASRRTPR